MQEREQRTLTASLHMQPADTVALDGERVCGKQTDSQSVGNVERECGFGTWRISEEYTILNSRFKFWRQV